jgi:hypothetical protein
MNMVIGSHRMWGERSNAGGMRASVERSRLDSSMVVQHADISCLAYARHLHDSRVESNIVEAGNGCANVRAATRFRNDPSSGPSVASFVIDRHSRAYRRRRVRSTTRAERCSEDRLVATGGAD